MAPKVYVETTIISYLAGALLEAGAIPAGYADDAMHVALAVVHGSDYLLTWNFRHLANAGVRERIAAACRAHGYQPVAICTPEELMED
jgi:hypothetical protein